MDVRYSSTHISVFVMIIWNFMTEKPLILRQVKCTLQRKLAFSVSYQKNMIHLTFSDISLKHYFYFICHLILPKNYSELKIASGVSNPPPPLLEHSNLEMHKSSKVHRGKMLQNNKLKNISQKWNPMVNKNNINTTSGWQFAVFLKPFSVNRDQTKKTEMKKNLVFPCPVCQISDCSIPDVEDTLAMSNSTVAKSAWKNVRNSDTWNQQYFTITTVFFSTAGDVHFTYSKASMSRFEFVPEKASSINAHTHARTHTRTHTYTPSVTCSFCFPHTNHKTAVLI